MDKKIKLNNFVTFNEVADYLSKTFGESVSLAEVYRLVLSKRLTASVRLLNQTCAVDGRYINTKDSIAYSNSQEYVLLDQKKGMVFDQSPCLIDGIWDLPMIGMESLIIENLYQNELNEFTTIDVNVKGVFVSQGDRIFKLKNVVNFCSDNEMKHTLCTMIFPPLRYKCISFIDLIFKSERKVQEIILKAQRDEAIAAFEEFKSQPSLNFVFEDSKSFDQHSHQLIIRTDELLRFSCSNQDDVIVKVSSNEFRSNESSEEGDLLGLIGVLCHRVGIDPSARGVTIAVQKMVELVGVSMSDDCIRQILLQTVQALDNKYPKTELTSKRRNTLLVLIGALCNSADIVPSADNATTVFQYMAKYFGALKSYDFISETLSQVALAIETRQK
ncbi:hypothetical protein [Photobacterium phosphoreum]|uniref:hypothetical protein n=1 Tax=Photobacterium phosphoreum TaxID=659 RepID=UPI0039AF6613